MDVVLVYLVVCHRGLFFGPAKAHRNAGIVRIGNFIVLDNNEAGVTCSNAHGSLMFVSDMGDQVVADGVTGADFVLVRGVVGNVDFRCGILGELANHDACCTQFVEHVSLNQVIVCARNKV